MLFTRNFVTQLGRVHTALSLAQFGTLQNSYFVLYSAQLSFVQDCALPSILVFPYANWMLN